MLDIRRLREHPDEVAAGLKRKGVQADLGPLLELDLLWRDKLIEVEALKQDRNRASKDIGRIVREGGDIAAHKQSMRDLGDRITVLDHEIKDLDLQREELLLTLPNLPAPGVPDGKGDEDNVLVRSWGTPRAFAFDPLPHWDLLERLSLVDFERGSKLSGSGFPLYTGLGARLQRALISFMLDLHVKEHGYTEVWPPALANADCMTGTGQLPKMETDMYKLPDDGLYMVPTAEVPVTNIYREEIIEQPLPLRLTAYSPCFRREAGAAGRDTRGLIRLHQFEKVEMVRFVKPETSFDALEELVSDAEDVLQRLELPYRVLELCAGDLSFAAAKCYDIELWAPGYQGWLEVSSCSAFLDFQARRAQIRYRDENGKPAYVHTLNGSGVALPRLIIALLENGQQADGCIALPQALHAYMGGVTHLRPPAA